ncbi:MAG: tetratricopeptide repeat protein [Planctomycetes bacterium]|nr:tetratricopeptide repeat protein [Planctomycetota bacterium]
MRILGGTALALVGSLSFVGPRAAQEDVPALAQRAARLVEQQRYSEALLVLDRCLAADASKAKLHVSRAFVRNKLGDHAGAVEDASRAIELDPQDFGAFYERGFSLYHQREFARALADYDRALALEPGIAALHGERGDLLREMDALGPAVAAYDAAIELRPTWVEAYSGRAQALNSLTDYAAALRDLRRATELAPEVPDLWWLRALSEAQCGDDAAALSSADEFVRLQPDELRAWATGLRAVLAWDAGELDLAAELFARAAQGESPNPEIVLCLGYAQLAAGKLDAAATTLESAARQGNPQQLGRARMMQWCIDARALGLDEAGRKLEERLGERIEELSAVERGLVGFCRTGDSSHIPGGLFPSEVCAWSFLAAWRFDVAGDRASAERWLRRCLNTGSFDSKEWKNALLWLRSRQPAGLRSMLGAENELATDPAGARGVVRSVAPGSAADYQGLRVGDELLDLCGRPLTREDLDSIESRGRIGLALRVTRRRAGAVEVLRIRLGVVPGT